MGPVRLFKVRSHFCQKLVGRNADIYREIQLTGNSSAYGVCGFSGISKQVNGLCHVQECLVNAEFFNVRGIVLQQMMQFLGAFYVEIKAGRHDGQRRTFAPGAGQRLSCGHTILSGQGGLGQHNAMAGFGIAAYCRGNGPQIYGIRVLLQPIDRFPAQEGRVYINVKNQAVMLHGISFPAIHAYP